MNSSMLYVAQAVGSGIGGVMFAWGDLHAVGYVAVALLVSSGAPLDLTWQRAGGAASHWRGGIRAISRSTAGSMLATSSA